MLDPSRIYIAGYQVNPGGEVVSVGASLFGPDGTPVESTSYTRDLEDAYRTLFRVEGEDGETHWYWMMGGVLGQDDAINRILDLQLSGEYPELGE